MKSMYLILGMWLSWMLGASEPPLVGVDYLALLDRSIYMEYATSRMEMYKNGKLMRFYELEFFRQDEKMRMEFTGPATEKGRRMLNDGASLWMYLPRTSKVMKLPFKQAFMGSDASNTDLMRMAFKKDYELVEITPGEGKRIELDLQAVNLEVAYHRMRVVFDTEKNVPVRQEMYSLSGKLIKTLLYDEPVEVDGTYFPSSFTIQDALKKNTCTKLFYQDIRKKSNKPAEFFTLASLKR